MPTFEVTVYLTGHATVFVEAEEDWEAIDKVRAMPLDEILDFGIDGMVGNIDEIDRSGEYQADWNAGTSHVFPAKE